MSSGKPASPTLLLSITLRRRLEVAKAIKGIKIMAKVGKNFRPKSYSQRIGVGTMSPAISVFSEITVCGWQASLTREICKA